MTLAPEVAAVVRAARTIAVVGLSADAARPSHGVARYLQRHGYRVVPVNPRESEVLGERAFASLDAIPAELGPIEIVDVFRRSEFVPEIGAAALRIGARMLWLQEGVSDPETERGLRAAGMLVVADRCLLKEHARLLATERLEA